MSTPGADTLRRVLAPGKVVVVGEYAVIDGAPAVVCAIDRGVACEIVPGTDGETVHIEVPGGDDRYVRPALEGAPPALYRFSDWNPVAFLGRGQKPGFGGSAAACVAACVAAGRPATDATHIHAQVQGGGSGIDVAAAIHGGTLRFTQGEVSPMPPLDPVVIWSGRSARTGPRVARWQVLEGRARFVRRSRQIVDHFADDPIAAMDAALALLIELTHAAGIDYLTPAHQRITDLARAHGGAAKPSGAGGGDCAIALFPDPDARTAFVAACAAADLPPVPVRLAPGAHFA